MRKAAVLWVLWSLRSVSFADQTLCSSFCANQPANTTGICLGLVCGIQGAYNAPSQSTDSVPACQAAALLFWNSLYPDCAQPVPSNVTLSDGSTVSISDSQAQTAMADCLKNTLLNLGYMGKGVFQTWYWNYGSQIVITDVAALEQQMQLYGSVYQQVVTVCDDQGACHAIIVRIGSDNQLYVYDPNGTGPIEGWTRPTVGT